MKIYKITKPGINEVYIGQTKLSLKERFRLHFSEQKRNTKWKIYEWLDTNCIIELLEEFESDEKDFIKEMNYIKYYENLQFNIINTKCGEKILDDNYNRNRYIINKENGKQKEWSKKKNDNINPDYVNWMSNISRAAKKLGLNSKQYKEQYGIAEFAGPKKKQK